MLAVACEFNSVQLLSPVQLFVTPWTVTRQAPLPMDRGFFTSRTAREAHKCNSVIFLPKIFLPFPTALRMKTKLLTVAYQAPHNLLLMTSPASSACTSQYLGYLLLHGESPRTVVLS